MIERWVAERRCECGAVIDKCPVCGVLMNKETWDHGVVYQCPSGHFRRTHNFMDGKIVYDRRGAKDGNTH